jgi:hypothetical protein
MARRRNEVTRRITMISCCLVLWVTTTQAADTPLHGVQGFTLHYAIAKALGASKEVCAIVGTTGLIFGIMPDLPYGGWRVHTYQSKVGFVNAVPGFALHIGLDMPWHSGSYGKHWAKDWKLIGLDVILWIVTVYALLKLVEEK